MLQNDCAVLFGVIGVVELVAAACARGKRNENRGFFERGKLGHCACPRAGYDDVGKCVKIFNGLGVGDRLIVRRIGIA